MSVPKLYRHAEFLHKLKQRKLFWSKISFCVCLLAVIGLGRNIWLSWAYSFLDISQTPRKADYIIILAGYNYQRVPEAIELYRYNYAPRVIVSGGEEEVREATQMFEDAGISPQVLIPHVPPGESTWEEAHGILALLQEEGANSAIIVTNRWHTRRVWATYRHIQAAEEIELTYVATSQEPYPADTWRQTKRGRIIILREYTKLTYYLVRYGVIPI